MESIRNALNMAGEIVIRTFIGFGCFAFAVGGIFLFLSALYKILHALDGVAKTYVFANQIILNGITVFMIVILICLFYIIGRDFVKVFKE